MDMDKEVTDYIQKLPKWQIEICESLRKMIFKTIPKVEERLQYGKPHYLKDAHYTCVIHAAKDKISFMIFNAGEINEIKGFLKAMSDPNRKVVTITEGQDVDYKLLAKILKQASASL